ncbi:centromere protein Q [Python bivittatus]|uniref:Centromere protein Q n=1 Tax=Python bivittatus TaxID=176946 RepID=A0A9F5IUG0_PYTBI|nr:centromere protein Q [Python bivittatus]
MMESSKQKVKCQQLPKSIKKSLESKIHWTIVSVIYEPRQNYSETEKCLNILKERLLKRIETLEVPVDQLNGLKNVRKILKEEEERYIFMEEGLLHLEGEIAKDSLAINTLYENIQILQKEIQPLNHELAALEAEADKLFHRDGNDDLGLPVLSAESLELPVLQNEVLKIGNPQALLGDMNVIQQSDEMKAMKAFLEQLYEKAEFQVE